jgi:hypothetical protein
MSSFPEKVSYLNISYGIANYKAAKPAPAKKRQEKYSTMRPLRVSRVGENS